ncbi:putative F-box protein PP2-B12 [Rosa rugosa]|uniref:putative F-box protein PP2-B12 n=1 Tax=Rosa rugosa TaxID=74645 RepID=UPI002B414376|nr:putative F-box protein PP2-B12 [Rosa rugosa]XP_062029405.1 putative F-box protein PP2-B12 [Rosa rugosa]
MQTMTFPEECLVDIISFTTPTDVCRLSSISRSFKMAGEADEVWEKFLPPQHDIDTILSQSTSASTSAAAAEFKVSKKELYLALCDKSVLIDNGKMIFFLEKWSGKKCYMISARALYIVWAEEKSNQYWTWICLPESRFKDVVYLESVYWIEMHGRIDMRMLSSSTLYKAYLVYKLTAEAYGLKAPVQVATQVGHYGLGYGDLAIEIYENRQKGFLYPAKQVSGVRSPKERVDGWLEIELGEFLCQGEDDSQVDMICVEIDDLCWKKGLVVEGIEVRPERKEYCERKGKARAKERTKGKKAMTMI